MSSTYNNTSRALAAWKALNQYSPAVEQDHAVSDLLADLMHLVDAQRKNADLNNTMPWPTFEFLLDRARENALDEAREDGIGGFPVQVEGPDGPIIITSAPEAK